MTKIGFAVALGATVFATTATAHDLATAFTTRGDCQVALRWADYDIKRAVTQAGGDAGPVNQYLHASYECQKINGKWYIVVMGG